MKTHPIKLSLGIAALFLISFAQASGETTTKPVLDSTITRVWTDSTCSTAFSTAAGPKNNVLQVGNAISAGKGGRPVEWRSVLKFDISGFSGTVPKTTLNLEFNTSVASPKDIFVTTIDDDDRTLSADGVKEFDAAALNEGVLAVAEKANPAQGQTISIDVTSILQADVDAGRTYSTFRLYVDPLNTRNQTSNVRIFFSEDAVNRTGPYLETAPVSDPKTER